MLHACYKKTCDTRVTGICDTRVTLDRSILLVIVARIESECLDGQAVVVDVKHSLYVACDIFLWTGGGSGPEPWLQLGVLRKAAGIFSF